MNKIIILLLFLTLFTSLASAEIIINKQPDEIYNLGDIISIPITIKSLNEASGSFQMNLICEGHEFNFYKNGVGLSAGEEKEMNPSLILTKNLIGELKGQCKIKGIFKEEYILTNDFIISNLIYIQLTTEEIEFNPGENILIEGGATKENNDNVNGFINLELVNNDSSENINQLETINNGFFSINISLPDDIQAGTYIVKLTAYEKNLEEITNNGLFNYNILIKQVPTNLEIAFENQEIEPGTNLRVKAILHDQTGEKIEANAIITIKNKNDKILEQLEKQTDEFLEFPIEYNEEPAEWTVVAVSGTLTNEATFKIKEKEDIRIELINKTVIITNTGNVYYNKTLLIKIGNDSSNIDVGLEVDETQKYVLTAPEGEYNIEIITDKGNKITGMAALTGKSIDVKKASGGVATIVRYSSWIFIIMVLGFVTFMIFKKGYRRSFFGYIQSKKKERDKLTPIKKNSMINSKNKAELSLSIKGDKQSASVVCLKIKNFKDIESKKGNANETLQKIVDMAEKNKAVTYESQNNLFFILAPIKTKTFKNEKNAIKIAQEIDEILTEHNKLFKQKIEFGISINYGTIIAKAQTSLQTKEPLKFMSMGTLITTAKKISSLSNNEILLSEKMNDRLKSDVKTEKQNKEKISVYKIIEMKNKEEHKKFIRNFLNRIEGKK